MKTVTHHIDYNPLKKKHHEALTELQAKFKGKSIQRSQLKKEAVKKDTVRLTMIADIEEKPTNA